MEGEHGAVEGPEVSVGVRVLVESSARPPTGGSTDCITARYGAVHVSQRLTYSYARVVYVDCQIRYTIIAVIGTWSVP